MTDSRDTMRWAWRAGALAVLAIGWLFVLWQNSFHISAPVVFVCLGYLAVVATVYNLWQTGAAAVAASDDEADSTWAKPAGAVGELEREKRTLLKAIKEAEFDHQMGKLSKHDVDEMVKGYRVRAIEVIKEIDRLGAGTAGTTRDQILREVRARLEIESRPSKKARQAKPEAKSDAKPDVKADVKADAKADAKTDAKPDVKDAEAAAVASADSASDASSASSEVAAAAEPAVAGDAAAAKPAGKPSGKSKKQRNKRASAVVTTAGAAVASAAATPAPVVLAANADSTDDAAQDDEDSAALDDEAMNADSTTAVEPRRSDAAKEAMR